MSLRQDPVYLRSSQYRDSCNLSSRATLHDRFSTNAQGWFPWLFERLELGAGDRVLDVGGGPGWVWCRGAPEVPRIRLVSTDLSIGMVREAHENVGGRVDQRRCVLDAQRIPFPDASFDVAIANHMLYHVPDRERALAELARVLVPGGRLYASTIGERHMAELDELAVELQPDRRRHMEVGSAFALETGADQLERHFVEVEVECYPDGLRVTELEPLLDYVRSMISLDTIEPAREASLRRRVSDAIARDGHFAVTKDTGLFAARRAS